MKNLYAQKVGFFSVILFLFLSSFNGFAQVGIGTTNPNSNALLDIDAAIKPGGLLIPRVGLRATNNPYPLTNPVPAGMIVYNTDYGNFGLIRVYPGFYYHDGSNWQRINGGPNTNWYSTGNVGTDESVNFVGTTDNAALRFRTRNTNAFEISGGGSAYRGKLRAMTDGTEALPVYSWSNSINMGLFRIGDNILGFSTNSNEAMRIMADRRVAINSTVKEDNAMLTVKSESASTTAIYALSPTGTAIKGESTSGGQGVAGITNLGRGVYGQSNSGSGVYGKAFLENAQGGYFINDHIDGFGLWAIGGRSSFYKFDNTGTGAVITGTAYGTTSFSRDANGIGVAGFGGNIGEIAFDTPPLGVGVAGMGKDAGVFGESIYSGKSGVYGRAEGNSGLTNHGIGVYGENVGGLGYGVAGVSTDVGVYGSGATGALFESGNVTGTGMIGVGNNITTPILAPTGSGVAGTGYDIGLFGAATRTTGGIGIIGAGNGLATYSVPSGGIGAGVAGTGTYIGVFGHSNDINGYGVYSQGNLHTVGNITATGDITAVGNVVGDDFAFSGGDLAIVGDYSGASLAVTGEINAVGNINSDGDITAQGAKNFIIDDPRDPANKYLKHASIESNEILNLYRGVATFDASGNAVVQLPDYYDLINKNASYQLTPIGAAMPNLYIATEVNNGSFKIAGGVSGKKVSWILTAERDDPYIRNNPDIRNMVVDKGADRGRYLAPESYGQSADQGIMNRRVRETQSGSAPAIAKQAIVAEELQSSTMEVQNLTIPFKSMRTENSGANELRDMRVIKAQLVEASTEAMKLTEQTTSETTQQASENEQSPTNAIEKKDNN